MVLYLLHIPKTAGTSVKHLLLESKIPYQELHMNRKLECQIASHLDEILADPTIQVILTMRNPVEHVLSTFQFYQEYPAFRYPTVLSQFIEDPELRNQQTTFLFRHRFHEVIEMTQPPIESERSRIEVLDRLLERPQTFIFLQDSFDASVTRLSQFLGVALNSQSENATKRFNYNKVPSQMIEQEVIDRIRVLNAIDCEVYSRLIEKYPVPSEQPIFLQYIPWQYPLNLVGGTESLVKYQTVLEKISNDLKTRIIPDFYSEWLDRFCVETDLVFSGQTVYHRLAHLREFLDDLSPRAIIQTRF